VTKKRKKMQEFYVYEDWTLELSPRCFYVGKGDIARVKTLRRNRHHTNIAQKYGVRREIMLITSIETMALEREVELIAERKTFVYGDYVFGANYTRGGEGVSGARFEWSNQRREDARQAQLRSFQKPERLAQHVAATTKQWQDQARRQEQSERMKRSNPSRIGGDTVITRSRKSAGQKRRQENERQMARQIIEQARARKS
jgi:hypothetical protein